MAHTQAMTTVRRAISVAVLVICSARSATSTDSGGPPQPNESATTSTDPAAMAAFPPLARLPRRWRTVPFGGPDLPRRPPPAAAALVSLLSDPAPARLALRTAERFTDTPGWAGERILFLGVDGRWRELVMSDLGLQEAGWPGVDTYGAGALSPDGRMWAAHTNAGVVLVDLVTGGVRHVAFPRRSAEVRYVSWIPGSRIVSAYARARRGHGYKTFHVAGDGTVTPASYDGSRTRFDTDGTPVAIERTAPHELTVTRWSDTDTSRGRWPLPALLQQGHVWGAFGESEVALLQTWRDRPLGTLWTFDKATGVPRARLRVPAETSVEGWLDDGSLVLLVDSARLIAWTPATGHVRRLMEISGPRSASGDDSFATISLPPPGPSGAG